MIPAPIGGPLAWAQSWAAERPTDVALVGPGLSLTVAELWDTALRISRGLADAGVAAGEVVALAGPVVLRPVLTLGALARGALAVGHTASTSVRRVVSFDDIPELSAERLVRLDLGALAAQADPGRAEHPGFDRAPGAAALLVSSSGSTGIPKLVMFTTEQLVTRVAAAQRTWIPDLRFASLLGPGSMSGQIAFLAALSRRTVHLVPGTPEQNLAQLRDHGIQAAKGSPIQLAELMRAARRVGERLPELQLVEAAGSPIPRALATDLAGWFGVGVRGLYGATEAGTVAIIDDATRSDAARLLPDAEVNIVDAAGERVADGVAGQVRIRTDGVASGYLAAAAPHGLADGWFLPGDLGRVEHGELTLLGRGDDLLNAAGVKVAPERIERAARELPGVEDAAATATVDAVGVNHIALAVVGDRVADPSAMVHLLAAELGDATPRVVVRVAAIPRTESGKIVRGDLRRMIETMLRPGIDL